MSDGDSEEQWLAAVQHGLRRPPGRSVLLLVDDATPSALPLLVRTLLPEYPETAVLHDATAIEQVPQGSVVVLLPRGQDLAWMNLHRPLFARRALRVVFWCDRQLAADLHLMAPDLFEWIVRTVSCPPLAPPHAVAGLRALLHARVAGCRFQDGSFPSVIAAAFPGRASRTVSASLPYEELVAEVRHGGPYLLCFTDAHQASRVQKVRWALAEARWRRPSLLIGTDEPCPGWWRLHGEFMPLGDALDALADIPFAGRLAALLGLEPEAVVICAALLRHGGNPRAVLAALLAVTDPGAAIARLAAQAGLCVLHKVVQGSASPPELRGLWNHPMVRRRALAPPGDAVSLAPPGDAAPLAPFGDAASLAARLDPLLAPLPLISEQDVEAPFVAELLLRRLGTQGRAADAVTLAWLSQVAANTDVWDAAVHWGAARLGLQQRPAARLVAEARALLFQGKPMEAKVLFELALTLREEALGAAHPETAESAWELAGVHLASVELEVAEALLRWALDIWQSHPSWMVAAAGAEASLGVVRLAQGRTSEAADALELAARRLETAVETTFDRPLLLGLAASPLLHTRLLLLRQMGDLWLRLREEPHAQWSFRAAPLSGLEELGILQLRHRPWLLYLTARGGRGYLTVAPPDDPERERRVPPRLLRNLLQLGLPKLRLAVLDDFYDGAQAQALADAVGAAVVVRAKEEPAIAAIFRLLLALAAGEPVEMAAAKAGQGLPPDAVVLYQKDWRTPMGSP